MMGKLICFLIVMLGICSCMAQGSYADFKIVKCDSLQSVNFIALDSIHPRYFFRTGDSIIIITNYDGRKNLALVMDLKSRKIVGSFMPYGRKKNQLLSTFSAGFVNNHLWGYDLIGNKIVTYDLSEKPYTADSSRYHTYPLDKSYYWVVMGDTSTVYASGNDTQYAKIDKFVPSKQGEIVEIGNFNDIPTRLKDTPIEWRLSQQAFLFIRPDQRYAALACRFTDKIEFFDLHSGTSKVLSGPDGYEAQYKMSVGENVNLIYTNKTKRAFLSGYASSKYLYLIYLGDFHYLSREEQHRKIMVFDWNGNFKKCYLVPGFPEELIVSEEEHKMYMYDQKTNSLEIYDLH